MITIFESISNDRLLSYLMRDDAPSEIIDLVKRNIVDKKNIHRGTEGTVIECGETVVKIFNEGKIPNDVRRLIRRQESGRRFKLLPTIMSWSNSYIVRKNYTPHTEKCERLMDILFGEECDIYDYDEDSLYCRYYDGNLGIVTQEEKDAIRWLNTLCGELNEIGVRDENADIIRANIGEDDKGEIIMFDFC